MSMSATKEREQSYTLSGEISSDLYSHQKTLKIIFLKANMIPTIILKPAGVNIYENIKGQA